MLDYKCYPVWLMTSMTILSIHFLPKELKKTALGAKFDDLQTRFDALFVNDQKEFSFK